MFTFHIIMCWGFFLRCEDERFEVCESALCMQGHCLLPGFFFSLMLSWRQTRVPLKC